MARTKTYTKKILKEAMERMGYSVMDPIVESNPGDLRVYKKSLGTYLETINLSSSGIVRFNGKKYSYLDDMMKDLVEYAHNKEFPADSYNPDYRPEYVSRARRCAVIEAAGFQKNGIGYQGNTNFISKGALGTIFGHCGEDALYLSDYSWIQFYDSEDETLTDTDKCNAIKSVLAAFNAANLAVLANNMVNMGRVETLKEMKIQSMDIRSFSVVEEDALTGIINLLETTIKNLKGVK